MKAINKAMVLAIAGLFAIFSLSAFAEFDDADANANGVPDWYEELYERYANLIPEAEEGVQLAPSITPMSVALRVNVMPDQERWSGEVFSIWGNIIGGTPPYDYEWDVDGDGTEDFAGSVADPRYIAVFYAYSLSAGTRQIYTGTLTVIDSAGDSDTDSVEVDVIEHSLDPMADEPVEIRDLEVNMAIQDGLRWLYLKQQANGSWSPGWAVVGITGEVILAFEVQGHFPTNDSDTDIYVDTVQGGLDFLFANANVVPIGLQTYGDPDTDGDGLGVTFGNSMYEVGIAIQAIIGSLAPNRVVNVPGSVNGWTYKNVAVDTADYLNWAQNENNVQWWWLPVAGGRGGWRYQANSGLQNGSDNSVSQWPSLGLEAAEGVGAFNIPTPQFVKDELNIWVGYIQNATNGASGYESPGNWNNIAKTGALLIEFYFLGDDITSARAQSALTFITNNWLTDLDHLYDWWGDLNPSYYALYSAMKGLRLMDVTTLLDSTDWYDAYAEILVDGVDGVGEQQADGSWPQRSWDVSNNGELDTAWAILILSPIVLPGLEHDLAVDIKPQSCPNPLNVSSKGVLPVAILGTENFDVAEVDIDTVLLEGVAPLRSKLEDVATPFDGELVDAYSCTEEGPDGLVDLTLKFDKQEIVAALGDVEDGDVLILTLTASLLSGNAVSGKDIVIIRKKGKGKGKKAPGLLSFGLDASFPNPGNPETWIPFKLAKDVEVAITIYSSAGRVIRVLSLGQQAAGAYLTKEKAAFWDGKNEFGEKVTSGIYFYNIQAGDFSATRKMLILK